MVLRDGFRFTLSAERELIFPGVLCGGADPLQEEDAAHINKTILASPILMVARVIPTVRMNSPHL